MMNACWVITAVNKYVTTILGISTRSCWPGYQLKADGNSCEGKVQSVQYCCTK